MNMFFFVVSLLLTGCIFVGPVQAACMRDDRNITVYENYFASCAYTYIFDEKIDAVVNLDGIVAYISQNCGMQRGFFPSKQVLQDSLRRGLQKSCYVVTIDFIQTLMVDFFIVSFLSLLLPILLKKVVPIKTIHLLRAFLIGMGVYSLFYTLFFDVALKKCIKKETLLRKFLQECSDYSCFVKHFNVNAVDDQRFLDKDYSQCLTLDNFNVGLQGYVATEDKLKFCSMVMQIIALRAAAITWRVQVCYQLEIANILTLLLAFAGNMRWILELHGRSQFCNRLLSGVTFMSYGFLYLWNKCYAYFQITDQEHAEHNSYKELYALVGQKFMELQDIYIAELRQQSVALDLEMLRLQQQSQNLGVVMSYVAPAA